MPRKKIEPQPQKDAKVISIITGKPGCQATLPVICRQIKQYRLASGMEQKELAKRIGVTANAVSNWENGRSRPDVTLIPMICDSLQITLYDLFSIKDPTVLLSAREQLLIDDYNQLTQGHKHVVDQLIETLHSVEMAETCPDLVLLTKFDHALAAGIGDPSEFEDEGAPVYVYKTPETSRADCIFTVNGDSMEPVFHDGQDVLVRRNVNGQDLQYGEIGAFMIDNETYIKEYQEDGLHSANTRYGVMRFTNEDTVYFIGKVIGPLSSDSYAKQSDIEKYKKLRTQNLFLS